MSSFGFFTVDSLNRESRRWFLKLVPETWRYYRGPVVTGKLSGYVADRSLSGWGWQIPADLTGVWSKRKLSRIWERLTGEFAERQIKIVGLESDCSLNPIDFAVNEEFPGLSDGKTLELLLFLVRFRNILRDYGLKPSRVKVAIIWEEGNLGEACARLIAREVRFLTLIYPQTARLERAGERLINETGVSPTLLTELPETLQGIDLLIQCGDLTAYHPSQLARRLISCRLFIRGLNLIRNFEKLPLAAVSKTDRLPLSPALGETMLRHFGGLEQGFWYGSQLLVERVELLAHLLKSLKMELPV